MELRKEKLFSIQSKLSVKFNMLSKPRIYLPLIVLIVLVGSAILAPYLSPYDPTEMNVSQQFKAPCGVYLLGTDQYGKDVLSNVIHGGRISLLVAALSVSLAMSVGACLGIVAGYCSGIVDNAIMRLLDILFAFPPLLLAIAIVAFTGSGVINVSLAIAVVYAPQFARVVRSAVIAVKQEGYVTASLLLGMSNWSIILEDIMPNVAAPLIVQSTLMLGGAIIYESALSFLGLGVPPPSPSWGRMLSDSRGFLELAPWTAMAPGIALLLVVISLNLLGDYLRDALDPTMRHLN